MSPITVRLRLLQLRIFRQFSLCQKGRFKEAAALYPMIEKQLEEIERYRQKEPILLQNARTVRIRKQCQKLNAAVEELLLKERNQLAQEYLRLQVDRELLRLENSSFLQDS